MTALPFSIDGDAGRAVGRSEALMVTVSDSIEAVETALATGRIGCPECGAALSRWGWARFRVVRGPGGPVRVHPRRGRCASCGVTQVLLPVSVLVRRADAVEVIGAALVARAAGSGWRSIAARLGRPGATVRGWLRAFASRAGAVRMFFTVLLVGVGVDPVPAAAAGTAFRDAVAAVLAAAAGAGSRWPGMVGLSPWRIACAATGGRLLAPGWPPVAINTNCP
jgi:hypothetical protein